MTSTTQRSYEGRAARAAEEEAHPLAEYLYRLMAIKRTNLCVSADVYSTTTLLRLAEDVGDHICVLKTHADTIDDFGERTIKGLTEIAKRKRFLIFEDRKFGDIGHTVEHQYVRGPLQIATWAHLVNAHLFPGPAIVTALRNGAKRAEQKLGRGVSTEIFVGTPEVSEDEDEGESTDGEDEALPVPPPTPAGVLSQITTQTSISANEGDEAPPTPASVKARRLPVDLEKRRSVRATTTIYQTFDREDSGSTSPPLDAARGAPMPRTDAERQIALAQLGDPPPRRALLLFAQMSSAGNLMNADYTAACVRTAREHRDFVLGFITQQTLNEHPTDNFLNLTPGVNLPPAGKDDADRARGDGLGQQYHTPAEVVDGKGVDIVIVGRGILSANNRKNEAERYQKEAWKAYETRLRA